MPIAATVLAPAAASLEANVLKVAIPAIGRNLQARVTALQWTLTSYLLGAGPTCDPSTQPRGRELLRRRAAG